MEEMITFPRYRSNEEILKLPRFLVQDNVYFDCNSTTPTALKAQLAARECMELCYGNPSSSHLNGIQAKLMLEEVRKKISFLLKTKSECICFTSGATEAIHLSIFSALVTLKKSSQNTTKKSFLLYGATEHKAVIEALNHWNAILGLNLMPKKIPVNHLGQLDFDFLEQHINQAAFVATMAVNNETGVVHDLSRISTLIQSAEHRPFWLVDSVQALGKINIDYVKLGIDYATFSGHKLYGPKGIGFLYFSERTPIIPIFVGGGQESGNRSGTENIPGVAALGAILDSISNCSDAFFQPIHALENFGEKIKDTLRSCFPNIVFNSPTTNCVPTCINFSLPGLYSSEIIDLFDSAGLSVSSGSACSAGKVTQSHVLVEMGLTGELLQSACRLSFGPATKSSEIEEGCKAIKLARRSLDSSPLQLSSKSLSSAESSFYGTRLGGLIQFRVAEFSCYVYIAKASKRCIIFNLIDPLLKRIQDFVVSQNLLPIAIIQSLQGLNYETEQVPALAHTWRLHPTERHFLASPSTNEFFFDSEDFRIMKVPLNELATLHDVFAVFVGKNAEPLCYLTSTDAFEVVKNGLKTNTNSHLNQKCLWLCTVELALTSFSSHQNYLPSFISLSALRKSLNSKYELTSLQNPIWENLQINSVTLNDIFFSSKKIQLIDVRESFEFDFQRQNLDAFPWVKAAINVPMSQIADFLCNIINNDSSMETIYIILCRSGVRSSKVALNLRFLGYSQTFSIANGLTGLLRSSFRDMASYDVCI